MPLLKGKFGVVYRTTLELKLFLPSAVCNLLKVQSAEENESVQRPNECKPEILDLKIPDLHVGSKCGFPP